MTKYQHGLRHGSQQTWFKMSPDPYQSPNTLVSDHGPRHAPRTGMGCNTVHGHVIVIIKFTRDSPIEFTGKSSPSSSPRHVVVAIAITVLKPQPTLNRILDPQLAYHLDAWYPIFVLVEMAFDIWCWLTLKKTIDTTSNQIQPMINAYQYPAQCVHQIEPPDPRSTKTKNTFQYPTST
ncbi:hypothetical protein H9P43_000223 [Blastocladiella emersonii ATCC 22665]|nr:hypothetical protein H9P43_000223 [Blastocladiella emersonii ATCC 22665]